MVQFTCTGILKGMSLQRIQVREAAVEQARKPIRLNVEETEKNKTNPDPFSD